MARKYIAGTKSDFDATYKRLLKWLYPLLSKALSDLLTFQSLWVKNILYIHPVYAPCVESDQFGSFDLNK